MKNNYLTVRELIERLKLLPPDAIPLMEEFRGSNHFVFTKDAFSLSSEDMPQLGEDNNIDTSTLGSFGEEGWEWDVQFYVISAI